MNFYLPLVILSIVLSFTGKAREEFFIEEAEENISHPESPHQQQEDVQFKYGEEQDLSIAHEEITHDAYLDDDQDNN